MSWKHQQHRDHIAITAFSELTLDPEQAGRDLANHIAAESVEAETLRASSRDSIRPPAELADVSAALVGLTRKDQNNIGDDATAFKNAVVKLVEDGTYRSLVEIHADMSHNMHGSMGPVGLLRFLAWHRRYLLAFEGALRDADRILRPTAPTPLSIPYWRWFDSFPAWLTNFLPAANPQTGGTVPPRKLAPPPQKPAIADIHLIIDGFLQQLAGQNVDGYTRFTWGIEGWGTRPDQSSLPAHNQVHAWVGGIMNNTMFSPTDPIFWLHHAEVDRLWHIWQLQHPELHPALTGADRVMDPWSQSYDDVASIADLGYGYESENP